MPEKKLKSGKTFQNAKKNIFTKCFYDDRLGLFSDLEYKKQAVYVTGIYFIIGFVWIALSDKLVNNFVDSKSMIAWLSMIKGWVYVFLTSVLIYCLVYSAMGKIKAVNDQLKQKVVELEKINNALNNEILSRKQSESKYKELYIEFQKKQSLLLSLINSIQDLVFYKNKEGVYLGCNTAFEAFAGMEENELKGLTDYDIFEMNMAEFFRAKDSEMLQKGKPKRNQEWVRYPDGRNVLLDTMKTPYYDEKGNILGLIGISRDITEDKKKEEEIHYLSHYDFLTGLFNRRFFEDEMKRMDTQEHYPLSIIICDINGLRIVNDVSGYSEGDRLLKAVAEEIRKICADKGIAARWGGDEFVILLPNISNSEAEKLSKEISDKSNCRNIKIKESLSIGFATKEKTEESIFITLKNAEDMMHKNKLTKSDSLRYFIVDTITRTLSEKDLETEEHAERLKYFSVKLGKRLKLSDMQLNELEIFALLHDVGKIAVSDSILNKKGRLTEEEWEKMKQHSEIGYRILKSIPELSNIAEYVLFHHESWDGKGYPKGLNGRNIPIQDRIVSIVDAYDAMTNDRPYRRAMSEADARKELIANAGKQFDPDIVKIFVDDVLS